MIIAVPTVSGGLDDMVAPNFGRAPSFTVITIDDQTKEIKETRIVPNPNAGLARAAGIQTASFLANLGVNVVIAPSIGPNAYGILSQAGIRISLGSGTVRQVVQDFVSGQLQEFKPDVTRPGYSPGYGPGFGRGLGRGRGFGGRW